MEGAAIPAEETAQEEPAPAVQQEDPAPAEQEEDPAPEEPAPEEQAEEPVPDEQAEESAPSEQAEEPATEEEETEPEEQAQEPEPAAEPAPLLRGPARAAADYITSLTVEPDPVESWDKVKAALAFDGGEEPVFRAGDVLEITWPTEGDVYLKRYARTIPLVNPEGITYADVMVTSAGAKVVFREAVNGLYDVKGGFWFEAMAVNGTDTNEEHTGEAQIVAGNLTAQVHVHKGASAGVGEGELPLFRKQADSIGGGWHQSAETGGWMMGLNPEDPTYTQWILTANEHAESVHSDMTIRDSFGPGQALSRDWAMLYSTSDGGGQNYEGTPDSVAAAWAADHPGCSLVFSDTGIRWVISRQAASGRAWVLVYRCDITDFSLAAFKNSADVSCVDALDQPQQLHDESWFAGLDQGGEASGLPRGTLQVTKKVEGTDKTVSGVKLCLQRLTDGASAAARPCPDAGRSGL